MTLDEQLTALVHAGVVLSIRGETMGVTGPERLLTPAVVEFLRDNKADAMQWIAGQQQPWTGYTFTDPSGPPACPYCYDASRCTRCEAMRLRETILNKRN